MSTEDKCCVDSRQHFTKICFISIQSCQKNKNRPTMSTNTVLLNTVITELLNTLLKNLSNDVL